MHTLSSPLHSLSEHYDVVVVGSGYGGGVAASRLARAGRSVCLLERGRERHPGEFPDSLLQAKGDIQVDSGSGHMGPPTALFDFRVNPDLNVLVGCGLGGTSLINANVSLPPDPRVFDDPLWPAAVRDDRDTAFADALGHARQMLRPTAYPEDWPALNKLVAHERAAHAMGQPFSRLPINVTFEDGVNHVGVEQRRCTLCGDCVTGCNESAKNTTLMNYVPDAWNHGAQIFTETLVRYVARQGERWAVHFSTMEAGRQRFGDTMLSITADVVVLAGGTLGSTEILLRSRARGLSISPRLGERFSGNGDVLGFAYDSRDRIDGVSTGPRRSGEPQPVGPCITSAIDLRNTPDLEEGLIVEEGSLPGAMAPYLALPFAAAGDIGVATRDTDVVELAKRKWLETQSVFGGAGEGALAHVQTFLVMSHDGSDGRLCLEDDRLRVDWPDVGTRAVIERDNAQLNAATAALGGIFVRNPLWSPVLGQKLITVHPLGGCPMGDDATRGVVNHKGQVYTHESGDAVHDGLYVMDGAVMPRSLGVNPLLTITAMAERNCSLLARDRGWNIDYRLPSSPGTRQPRASVPALEFTERMAGFFSTAVTGDYGKAAEQGERDGSRLEFVLTVATGDLESMLRNPEHPATLFGTVRAPELSPGPMTVLQGQFNLFVEDAGEIHAHRMRYRVRLHATDGRTLYLDGFKLIRDAWLFDTWRATTTLYVTVHNGPDAGAPVLGRGILRIAPLDFARQLTTMTVRNSPDPISRARALGAFGHLFAGRLWEHFGGALSSRPAPGDRAVVRQKRTLAAPLPEVRFFAAGDGVGLRLVRYNGGARGPLVCAPGFSNTSQVFSWDGIETSWVEFFTRHEYDVWLFDYRASPDLPASRTQFTLDDVAVHDWPAAVSYVRQETGAGSVQALGHCLGSATGFMALLSGQMTGVRQFVGSQVMPFIETSHISRLKAKLHGDRILRSIGADEVNTHAGRDRLGRLIDEVLRLHPMPLEWQTLGPVCRRIYAIYGPVMKPSQLNRDTRDALDWIFGYGNLTAFGQISQFIRHRRIVDAAGRDVYLPNIGRLKTHVVLMHGSENKLFPSKGSEETLRWIREHHGAGACTRLVFPGYAHLDCFIGRDAARDVFPGVLGELDAMN
ncbi:MAG TPA: alpha/beta fold hydrolase [Vicinamibacterales bacterium]